MTEMTIDEINAQRAPFLELPDVTRQALEEAYADFVEIGEYGDAVPGYVGWRELPVIGVTSYIRDDGSLQYDW